MTNQTETQKYLAAIEEAKEKVALLMQYLNELEQHEKHYEIESYDVRETTRLKDEITNVCTSCRIRSISKILLNKYDIIIIKVKFTNKN